MVGILEEGGSNIDGDVYPDGPLQSGTQSLRKISSGQKSKVCIHCYSYCIQYCRCTMRPTDTKWNHSEDEPIVIVELHNI